MCEFKARGKHGKVGDAFWLLNLSHMSEGGVRILTPNYRYRTKSNHRSFCCLLLITKSQAHHKRPFFKSWHRTTSTKRDQSIKRSLYVFNYWISGPPWKLFLKLLTPNYRPIPNHVIGNSINLVSRFPTAPSLMYNNPFSRSETPIEPFIVVAVVLTPSPNSATYLGVWIILTPNSQLDHYISPRHKESE